MGRLSRSLVMLAASVSVCGLASVAAASSGQPTPATAAAIVLTRADVANVLHERVEVAGEKTYATPKEVFRTTCGGLDVFGVGASSVYGVATKPTETSIGSTVLIRLTRTAVARDFAAFGSRDFPGCDFAPGRKGVQVTSRAVSLPRSSAAHAWRMRSAAPSVETDLWAFAVGRDEILLSSIGTTDLSPTAATRFLTILLSRAIERPH